MGEKTNWSLLLSSYYLLMIITMTIASPPIISHACLPARHCPLPSHTITARPPPQLLLPRPLPLLPLHPLRPQPPHLCPFLLLELPQQLLLLVLHEVFANPRLHLLDPGVTVLVVLVLGVELLPRPVSLVLLLRLPLLLLLHFDYLLRHSAVALRALDHVVQSAVVPVSALLLDCPLLLRVPRHVPLLGVGAQELGREVHVLVLEELLLLEPLDLSELPVHQDAFLLLEEVDVLLLICDSAHLHADEAVDLLLLLEGTALHLLGGDVSLEHADLVVQRLLAFRLVLLPLLLRVQLLVLLHDFAVVPVVNVPFLLRQDVQPTVSAHNNKYIYPPPTHSQPPFVDTGGSPGKYWTAHIIIMFDKQKARQLEQRSHNRGLLSKEFYHNEQMEQERKRRELKQELDRQTEEHRRQKEQKRLEEQRRIKKEEEEISSYYRSLENREKKLSGNDSALMQNSSMRYYNQPALTYPNENHHDSRLHPTLAKNRANSKTSLLDGDIPLMPVLPTDYNVLPTQHLHANVLSNSKQNLHKQSIGNIPLLDLSEETNLQAKFKKGKQKTSKRERTLEMGKEQSLERERGNDREKIQESRKHNGQTSNVREERRSTLADEESIYGSNVKGAASLQKRPIDIEQIQEEIEQVENENLSLKSELKKNQQALSLLIGAVRSNGKLDKFRVQAEKILSGGLQQSVAVKKEEERKEEERLMLPKINLRHQSILHDYLINAARRCKKPK